MGLQQGAVKHWHISRLNAAQLAVRPCFGQHGADTDHVGWGLACPSKGQMQEQVLQNNS